MYRTIAKKAVWDFDSIIMQNLSDILPLFCTPTWPSHHVSENQEYSMLCCKGTFLSELPPDIRSSLFAFERHEIIIGNGES